MLLAMPVLLSSQPGKISRQSTIRSQVFGLWIACGASRQLTQKETSFCDEIVASGDRLAISLRLSKGFCRRLWELESRAVKRLGFRGLGLKAMYRRELEGT